MERTIPESGLKSGWKGSKTRAGEALSWLPLLVLILAFPAFLLSCAKDPGPLTWEPDAISAIAKAEGQKMPVLMLFSSPTCPHCKKMKEEIFPSKRFRVAAHQFVTVEVVANPQTQSIYEMFSVKNIPTILMLSPSSQELHRFIGEQTEDALVVAMQDSLKKSKN
ncbi:MAG: thioredoxin fold domain-containing protein [Thermodesulfobacteriota bacterium]